MDVLGSEGGGVSRIRDTVGEQCFGISFWLFRNARWGHPKPRPACFHWSGEHACGVAICSPTVAVPAHPCRNGGDCCRQSKSFLSVDFAWGLTYFRLPRIIIVQGRQRRVSVKRWSIVAYRKALLCGAFSRGCAITSNRSRLQGRKKMLRPSCSRKTAFFFVIEREYG